MKKLLVFIALLSMIIAANSWAALINSGSLTVANGGLAYNGFQNSPTLTWNVNSNESNTQWTYYYSLSNPGSSNASTLSFINVEVGPGFSLGSNLISDTVTPNDVSATGPANYNSGVHAIYGLQWDFTNFKNNVLTLILVTNTRPMWGDIYIGGETTGNFAKNTGFGPTLNNPNAITGNQFFTFDGTTYASVLVPTPIPGAAWLLGTGLVALIMIRRRRRR